MEGSESEEGNSESEERYSESERSLNVSYSYCDELDSNSVVEPYSFEPQYVWMVQVAISLMKTGLRCHNLMDMTELPTYSGNLKSFNNIYAYIKI